MSTEHKDILSTAAQCHEPQGFDAASNDTVLTKSGAGAIEWELKSALAGDTPHGHAYISTPAATTIGVADTYVKIGGVWTGADSDNISFSAGTWTITVAGSYVIHVHGSGTTTNGDTLGLDIAVNDTAQGFAPSLSKMNSLNDVQSTQGSFYLSSLSVDDTVDVYVTNVDDSDDVTFSTLSAVIHILHSS